MKRQPLVKTLLAIVSALAIDLLAFGAPLDEDPNAVSLPLEIEINGSSKGEVIVRSTPSLDIVEIQGTTLKDLLREAVAEELTELVESLPDTFASLERFRELGIEIELDLERLVIAISIQEKIDPASLLPNSIYLGYQRNLHFDNHTDQAKLSGYANFRWNTNHSSSDSGEGKTTHSLGIGHVLNIGGYAIEGESVWNERDSFRINQLRVVRDFPNRLWRLNLGDISTPITDLQRGHQLFGASLVKEFGIQPYRTFTPTGSAAFQLEETATVQVKVNGRVTKTLELEPGQYNIEEFKLAAGRNNMELQIESRSGLVDTLNVSEFGSSSLLGKGISTYALSFGFPKVYSESSESATVTDFDWYRRIVSKTPVYSSYFRKGIHNQLTVSGDIQGSDEWNRVGMSFFTANEHIGALDATLSYNQSDGNDPGFSSQFRWNRRIAGIDMAASAIHADASFNLFENGQTLSLAGNKSSYSLSLSKLLNEKISVSTSAFQNTSHDGNSARSLSATIGRRFRSVYLSSSFRYSLNSGGEKYGAYITATWNPSKKWRNRTQARYDNTLNGFELSSRMNYSSRGERNYTNAAIDAKASSQGRTLSGNYSRRNSLYSASFAHRDIYDSIEDFATQRTNTSFNFETAIAFADGSFGITRNVRDSFAIVDQHKAWQEVKLGINPTLGGYEQIGSNSLLSPVLGNLSSYREEYAMIQTVESDLFLERNDYYFFPGYRRGTRLEIGNNAIYNIRSTLYYSDGDPVKYKPILLKREDGFTVSTFTNAAGRFMASSLEPGIYHLQVHGTKETKTITIKDDKETMIFVKEMFLEDHR